MKKFLYHKLKIHKILNNYLNHPLLRIGISFDSDGDIGYSIESEYSNIELYCGYIINYDFVCFHAISSKAIKNILRFATSKDSNIYLVNDTIPSLFKSNYNYFKKDKEFLLLCVELYGAKIVEYFTPEDYLKVYKEKEFKKLILKKGVN